MLLDNLEQLDAQAGESIAQLLAMAPGLHVLATSRQLLDLNGEQAFELDGLPLPLPGGSAAQASINPAVMLFIDRARAARADFAPDADQLAAVVGLVRLLGGMPLAIELAASRVRTVPPTQLLQRLSEGAGTPMLDLLARGAQRTTAGSRHASMRHVLAYSWRQLSPQQAALMRDLAVLAAPAVPACVAAVAGLALAAAQPLLDSLCDACLLRLLPDERGVLRYSQQQPVREYAAETGNAEHSCAARQRLRLWLTQHLQAANARGYAQLMQAAVPELPQVYAALASAPLDGQGGQAWDLAITLRDYWHTDDPPLSSALALHECLPAVQQPAARSAAHEMLALCFMNLGQQAVALTHADAALEQAVLAADDRLHSLALTRQVFARYAAGQLEATDLVAQVRQAVALGKRCGNGVAQAGALRIQAFLVCNLHLDYALSERLSAQAVPLWRQAGHRAMERSCLMGCAIMQAWQGHEERAVPVMLQCEAAALADGDWVGVVTASRQLGRVYTRLRQWPQALASLRHAVDVAWQRRQVRGLANALINTPEVLLHTGQAAAGAQLHGFAVAHWVRLFGPINRIETAELKRARRMLSLHLGSAKAQALREQGQGLSLAAAVALVMTPAVVMPPAQAQGSDR